MSSETLQTETENKSEFPPLDELIILAEENMRALLAEAGAPSDFFDKAHSIQENRTQRTLQDCVPALYRANVSLGRQGFKILVETYLEAGIYDSALQIINQMQGVDDSVHKQINDDINDWYGESWLEELYSQAKESGSKYAIKISHEVIWQNDRFYLKDLPFDEWSKRYIHDLESQTEELILLWKEMLENTKTGNIVLDKETQKILIEENYLLALNSFGNLVFEKASQYHKGLIINQIVDFAKYLGKNKDEVMSDLRIGWPEIALISNKLSRKAIEFLIENNLAQSVISLFQTNED